MKMILCSLEHYVLNKPYTFFDFKNELDRVAKIKKITNEELLEFIKLNNINFIEFCITMYGEKIEDIIYFSNISVEVFNLFKNLSDCKELFFYCHSKEELEKLI